MKYTASRLSEGNKIFPAEIHIERTGITVKIPGLFKGESKYFDFYNIASVDIKDPMIGYSTVIFYAGGTTMSAHGFTRSEVKQIKKAIEDGKSGRTSEMNQNSAFTSAGNNATPGSKKDGLLSRMMGLDDESMKLDRQREIEWEAGSAERNAKNNEDIKKAVDATGKFIGGILSSGARKKAHLLHQELINITDDIDIAIKTKKMEEAQLLIKKLQHTSEYKIPNSEISYADYWNAKRKEYINMLTI